jgi:hypothetical protein
MDAGEVVQMPPEVRVKLATLEAYVRFLGPVNIQFISDGSLARITDINLRFGGGTPLSIEAGLDSMERLACMVRKTPFEASGDSIAIGTRAISYLSYIFQGSGT